MRKHPGDALASGDIVGSIEGFKAISDLYCCGDGKFAAGNPGLATNVDSVGDDPYGAGWLYEFTGTPDAKCIALADYRSMLDATIDKILEKQGADYGA